MFDINAAINLLTQSNSSNLSPKCQFRIKTQPMENF